MFAHTSTSPSLDLLCLPHAGGSAVMYHPWRRPFAETARVVPVELPGHGVRRGEEVVSDLDDLVRHLALRMSSVGPSRRYVLFGHSFGALVAFELARVLAFRTTPPIALVVSGRNAPSVAHPAAPLHQLADRELVEGVRSLDGLPEQLLAHQDVLDLFLPLLRADLRMAETYRLRPGPRLRCPVWVLAGENDALVTPDGLAAWQAETVGPCVVRRVPGGHSVLDTPAFQAEVVDALASLDGLEDDAVRNAGDLATCRDAPTATVDAGSEFAVAPHRRGHVAHTPHVST